MKNAIVFIIFFFGLAHTTMSQIPKEEISRLKKELSAANNDSARLKLYFRLGEGYRFSNFDSSYFYTDKAIDLAAKLGLPFAKSDALSLKGATLLENGKLPESMQYEFEALEIAKKLKTPDSTSRVLNGIGNIYMELADYKKAIEYYRLSQVQSQEIADSAGVYNEISNIGNVYELMGKPDSALYYQQIVYQASLHHTDKRFITRPEMMFRMGNAYKLNGNDEKALFFYRQGVVEANIDNDLRNLSMNNLFMAKLYFEMNQPDSSMKYARDALQTSNNIYFRKVIYDASLLISEIFKQKNDFKNAYNYLAIANVQRDSLMGARRLQELQGIILNEQGKQRTENEKRVTEKNRNRQLVLLSGLVVFLFVAFVFYRNSRQKRKANGVLEKTLSNLKATQSQLIQSEKMASLGELTAGIAHEIQNPLNFVNNFSEVNTELIDELQQEVDKGNYEDVKAIANGIKENSEKINHHGKRAGDIVKGMLQHSRSSTGVKEPTDINALVDEYLRLSYQGLRAKDKDFNATTKTDFDQSIGQINIIPQDIGRVILNLINNAFYAVNEHASTSSAGQAYEPIVSVTTKKSGNSVLITVSDNGNGIPQKIVDKIFQPFFTTKPTGQGTGLGLSLSYDIVKAHGGEIKVETSEADGSTFIIQLPNV